MIFLTSRGVESFQRTITRFVLLLSTLCAVTAAVSAQTLDWEVLNQGRVLTEYVKDPQGVVGVRAQFLVKARSDLIWSTFIDYDSYPILFDSIKTIALR